MENCSPSGDEIPFQREEGNLILIEFQISIDRFWKLRLRTRGRSIESRGENKRGRYALQVENPDMWSDARSNFGQTVSFTSRKLVLFRASNILSRAIFCRTKHDGI